MSKKYALVIANTEYADTALSQLPQPGKSANEVAQVLYAKKKCAFDDVVVLFNEKAAKVAEAIDFFLANRNPSDLVVLYITGHCFRNEFGAFYFPVINTRRSRLRSTAINADFIREAMDQCRAQRQVLILDCFNSSVPAEGETVEVGDNFDIGSAFASTESDRCVLAASDTVHFAWRGDKVAGEPRPSPFSRQIVKGLEGEADSSADGNITVSELFNYVTGTLGSDESILKPRKWSYQQGDAVVLHENIHTRPFPRKQEGTGEEAPVPGVIDKTQEQLLYEKMQEELRREAEEARIRAQREKFEQIRRAERRARWRPVGFALGGLLLLAVGFFITRALASQPEPIQTPIPVVPTFTRVPETPVVATEVPTETVPTEEPQISEPVAETSEPVTEVPEVEATEVAATEVAATEVASTEVTATEVASTIPGGMPAEIVDSFGVPMVLVPEGNYMSGNENGDIDEVPVNSIFLDSFYIDKFEVTNALYARCVNEGACRALRRIDSFTRSSYFGNPEFDNYPVVYVDWNMANAFCEWRGAKLPTEAQWEKAARGQDGRTYPWGEEIDCRRANYQGGSASCPGGTTMVGTYATGVSPYGAHDMAGNVWEWVADWYSEIYYQSIPAVNPLGPEDGQSKVLRGGSWADDAPDLRVSNRLRFAPNYINFNIGFRCAMPVQQEPE